MGVRGHTYISSLMHRLARTLPPVIYSDVREPAPPRRAPQGMRVLGLRTVRIDSVRRSVLGALRGLARATRVGGTPPEELRCTSCSICLEDFTKGELALRLPCGHLFHGPCIGTWLSSSCRAPTAGRGTGCSEGGYMGHDRWCP